MRVAWELAVDIPVIEPRGIDRARVERGRVGNGHDDDGPGHVARVDANAKPARGLDADVLGAVDAARYSHARAVRRAIDRNDRHRHRAARHLRGHLAHHALPWLHSDACHTYHCHHCYALLSR